VSADQIVLGYFVIGLSAILIAFTVALFMLHIRSKPTDGSIRLGWGMRIRTPPTPYQLPESGRVIHPTRPFEPLEPYESAKGDAP
jgi:hypothetical protein